MQYIERLDYNTCYGDFSEFDRQARLAQVTALHVYVSRGLASHLILEDGDGYMSMIRLSDISKIRRTYGEDTLHFYKRNYLGHKRGLIECGVEQTRIYREMMHLEPLDKSS